MPGARRTTGADRELLRPSRFHHRVVRGISAVAGVATLMLGGVTANAAGPVGSEHFALRFGDFTAAAELDYPADVPRAPLVVLIAGSGPEDMNAGRSGIFRDIARELTGHGYAVMRYNKRYVTGSGAVARGFGSLTMNDLRADAEQVLDVAENDRHVDRSRVFLYGWSEGSTVAAALAAVHPELAGVIFQGPVSLSWRRTLTWQVTHVVAPYLRRFATGDELGPAQLRRADHGDGGFVAAHSWINFAVPGISRGDYTVGAGFDVDRDGRLDVDRAFVPGMRRIFDSMFAPGSSYIYAHPLPTVLEQAPRLTEPTLVLQGLDDANVPVVGSVILDGALAAAGNRDHTMRLFSGLGHSLGPAGSVETDDFRPIDPKVLVALDDWLRAHR